MEFNLKNLRPEFEKSNFQSNPTDRCHDGKIKLRSVTERSQIANNIAKNSHAHDFDDLRFLGTFKLEVALFVSKAFPSLIKALL